MPFDPSDLEEMLLVKEHLQQERNFAITACNWPRVSVMRQKIKHCDNIIAKLRCKAKVAA